MLEPLHTVDRDFATEKPVSDEVFRIYRDLFAYDEAPLNAKVESIDQSNETWTMEKVTFDAAYGNERVIAYLFLPRTAAPPYQTLVLFPGANAVQDRTFTVPRFLYAFLLETGRAVVMPIYKGTFERQDGLTSTFPNTTTFYRDHVVAWAKDVGRSIDYLETRSEIDSERLAYYGVSWGPRSCSYQRSNVASRWPCSSLRAFMGRGACRKSTRSILLHDYVSPC